eukprot:3276_1
MASKDYVHNVLTIKCCIESATITRNPVHIKITHINDWDQILQSLLYKITKKKFKFLSKMPNSQWSIQINGETIDKTDGSAFKQMLSSIPPIPILEIIVATQIDKNSYIVKVQYKEQTFDFKLFGDKEQWDKETFKELKQAIREEFDLQYEFILYENISDKAVYIDDINDISAAFYGNIKQLDLFVNTTVKMNKFKVILGTNTFNWIPPQSDGNDEKEWNENYISLLHAIKKQYNVDPDDMECSISNGDDILKLWRELIDDEDKYIAKINVYVESKDE